MILLAAGRTGVARAEEGVGGSWSVTRVLEAFRVTCLATTPTDRSVVWAGTEDGAVLRSVDGGRTWSERSGFGGGALPVRSLAVSRHDPGVVVAGTKPAAVFVTRDAGATWTESEGFRAARRWFWMTPSEPPDFRPYVSALSISPTSPDVIVAGIEAGGVVRTADGGRTWSAHRRRADRDCHALAFHGTDGSWAYEAGGGGPAVSRDGGVTWRHVTVGLDGRYCVACAADCARPEVWYVSASPYAVWPQLWRTPVAHHDGHAHGAIYRSAGGAHWERLAGGLPQPLAHTAYGLAADPERSGHVLAALSDGRVWRSTDFGDTWERIPADLEGVRRAFVLA